MSHKYLDKLDPERQKIFYKLREFADKFVLAGGTAIMLQIGHRFSYDFDLFSLKPLSRYLGKKISSIFGYNTQQKLTSQSFIFAKTKEGVDLNFVYHPYRPLNKTVKSDAVSLFSLNDLAANKAYTIGRRGAWRDYVDIFILLKWRLYNLSDLITLADKKFGGEFNGKLFLGQLTYFKDVPVIPVKFVKDDYTESEIKSFLEDRVDDYVKTILKI